MPSFNHRGGDFTLTAGTNSHYVDLSFLAAYKNPRIRAIDAYIVSGTGTCLLSVALKDNNKDYGVSLINAEAITAPVRGVNWYGDCPCDWASWLMLYILNGVASDIARVVMVIEHD